MHPPVGMSLKGGECRELGFDAWELCAGENQIKPLEVPVVPEEQQ
jgi:hypothetical protein